MKLDRIKIVISAAALAVTGAVGSVPAAGASELQLVPGEASASRPGIDFVYVDPELRSLLDRLGDLGGGLQPVAIVDDLEEPAPHPLVEALNRGLQQYQADWGGLPAIAIPDGPLLKPGSSGNRVELLRMRLGLSPQGSYDAEVTARVAEYQRVHGLGTPDGLAGQSTVASLNLGPEHYLHRIAINIERASHLPARGVLDRYVVVDSGDAKAYLFQGDSVADSMRVVVGAAESQTPMMAVLMRSALAKPYWNVPADMIADTIAARVLRQGVSYLSRGRYDVFSHWNSTGRLIDPKEVDWKQVAAGGTDIHVRQRPGFGNAMGEMKFEMPNRLGIYLHDTPGKQLFRQAGRWVSNGCVRLEDYRRFATWVFDRPLQPGADPEQVFELDRPMPIFLTYFTVEAADGGLTFREDPYGHDAAAPVGPALDGPTLVASAR